MVPAPAHSGWTVRPVRPDDHDRWRRLYAGYAAFYRLEQTDAQAERTWSWLMDPDHELDGLVAEGADGQVAGLAHVRAFARPSTATVGGYLDDLFVDPAARGSGAADALLATLARLAGERGWSVVRWITAEDNHRARAKYDRHATRTPWVTYDMAPAPAARQLVSSGAVWEPVVGYSRAVRVGPWVAVAGTTAATPDGGPVGGDDVGAQTREALRRVLAALREVGAGPEHVVRTRLYVTDISRWEQVGRAHGEVFGAVRPASSMVEVSALIEPALLVEVEADAVVP